MTWRAIVGPLFAVLLLITNPAKATEPAAPYDPYYSHYVLTKIKIDKLLAKEHISNVDSANIARHIVNTVATKDINVIVAMGWQESRYNPKTISRTNDRGILQVNPRWHPEYDKNKLLELEYGLKAGYEIYRNKCSRKLRLYSGSNSYEGLIKNIIRNLYV